MNPAIELSKTLRNSPFYYRPLCLTSAVFVLSLSACVLFGWIAMLFTAIPVLIYAVFWFRRLGSYRLILPWIMLAVLALTAAVFGVYSFQRGKTLEIALSDEAQTSESETPNSKKSVMAEVVSEYYSEVFGSSHYVKLLEIDGEKVYGHAVLESEDPLNAQAYDIIRADCTFSEYTNI
ncbi:MAG: hypothetical protein IKB34_03105, partial [Clostridia bacterium]|nr:hypothetical protein [Clostridia bacterium]